MKVKLITFSDGSYGLRAAGKRLVKQADATGWFHCPSEHWTLSTLRSKMPDFMMEHEDFIRMHSQGLGLWIWQPAILSYVISQLEEGEIVLFLDAGCQLNLTRESDLRFKAYLEFCVANDMLLMQLADNSFGFDDVSDAAWTKQSVLEALDPLSTFRLSNQIQSGIIFAAKSARSERISSKWLEYCKGSQYSYLLNPSPGEPQAKVFNQHRFAQSIISLLIKSERINPLVDETYYYPNWSNGLNFPIWAMRNRSGGDAYRRNVIDLFMISLARIERELISVFKVSR